MTEVAAAAPAAPAAAAPPVAQADAATPVVSQHATQDGAPARKALAPIPPGRLPGVFPDGDPFPAPPGSGGPQRGPDGRFVAGASPAAAPAAGEHTLEPAAPAERFKFAGEEFESQSAAEQNFKSLRGQFKPIQALAKHLGGVDKIATTLSSAAESARAWKAHAESLQAELDGRGARQPAVSDAPSGTDAASAAEGIDWNLYAEVRRLANEKGEPWAAEQWLIEKVREVDAARYQKMLDERLAPLDAQQEAAATEAQTGELFGTIMGYTNSDGSPAFPELANPDAAFKIGRLWASLGLPREFALTPQGAMAAIALHRMVEAYGSQARPSAAAPQAPVAPAAPTPSAPTDTQAAASLDGGRPRVMDIAGGQGVSPEAARILQGLRQAQAGGRAKLGFDS